MNAGVVDDDIGFGQFPNGTLNAGVHWSVYGAHCTKRIVAGMRKAELDGYWFQSAVVSEEEQCSGGIDLPVGGVDAP